MKKILLVQFCLVLFASEVFAYHLNVHETITKKAIASSNVRPYLKNNLNISLDAKLRGRYPDQWIELGSQWEDDAPRWFNHFYDPISGKGLNGTLFEFSSSLRWGRSHSDNEYDWVRTRLFYYLALTKTNETDRGKYFSSALRSLGQVIHLVHDLAVPSHVRNDPHNAPYVGLPYDMYESYTRNNVTSLTFDGYPAVDIAALIISTNFG